MFVLYNNCILINSLFTVFQEEIIIFVVTNCIFLNWSWTVLWQLKTCWGWCPSGTLIDYLNQLLTDFLLSLTACTTTFPSILSVLARIFIFHMVITFPSLLSFSLSWTIFSSFTSSKFNSVIISSFNVPELVKSLIYL